MRLNMVPNRRLKNILLGPETMDKKGRSDIGWLGGLHGR